MATIPTGTVAFLFTDVEGSTQLWESHGDAMKAALARHESVLRRAIEAADGYVFEHGGDGFCVAFPRAQDAVDAAVDGQLALRDTDWSDIGELRVRMAVHAGTAAERDHNYFGPVVNRAARLMGVAHGGQVIVSEVTQRLVCDTLPGSVTLRDLGSHRLRDLARPEQVYQVQHQALPAEFPPLRSLDSRPNNLPTRNSRFVGREAELEEVARRLEESRLVTLLGTGGTGKTRLALQAAPTVLERFPDGAWFVGLADISDPELVAQTMATALGVRSEPRRAIDATLVSYLSERELLVILDNCEHVIGAAAALVDNILAHAPRVRVLATSRETLGVEGEQRWHVPPLPAPGAGDDKPANPEELSQFAAVELFIDRAMLAKPGFAVTNANAPVVAELCWRLDGIPLAIELAAARVRTMSVDTILERLDHRFRLLTGGQRAGLPHHRTLRAAIDWSHDLLGERERALLRRLSVFSGGWLLESAEAVCSDDDTVDEWAVAELLNQLVDKSLVIVDEGEEPRFGMLQTMRDYADQQLQDAGEADEIRSRHQVHFTALAEAAEPNLSGPEQASWFDRLDAELDNLRAALSWAGDGGDVEQGLRLGCAPRVFWDVRGYHREVIAHLDNLLAHESAADDAALRARGQFVQGGLMWRIGQLDGAQPLIEESLSAFGRLQLRDAAANARNVLAGLSQLQGDYATARELYVANADHFREVDQPAGVAMALNNLANLDIREGNVDAARAALEKAVAIHRDLGDTLHEAAGLQNLGRVALECGDYEAARQFTQESIDLARELGELRTGAGCLGNLANIHLHEGDLERARELNEAARELFASMGSVGEVAQSQGNLAIVALESGSPEEARGLLAAALETFAAEGITESVPSALLDTMCLAAAEGDHAFALRIGAAARRAAREVHVVFGVWFRDYCENWMAISRTALGDKASAEACNAGLAMTTPEAVAAARAFLEAGDA